jgi:hypothetical protein
MTSENINQPLQSDVHFNAKTKFWNCTAQSHKTTEMIAQRMLPLMLIGHGGWQFIKKLFASTVSRFGFLAGASQQAFLHMTLQGTSARGQRATQ